MVGARLIPGGNHAATDPLTQFIPVPIMQTPQPQQRGQQLNNLYKTALCKHYTQHKHCVKGNGCHFAHGESELRRKDEQLPIEVQYKMLNIPYNNYKTQVCKYFEQEKQCHFGKNCTYAHGKDELRKPYEELPVEMGTGLEITNPNAFRLLKAQVQAVQQPRFILNSTNSQPQQQQVQSQILSIGNLLRTQQDDQGIQLLNTLLQNKQISAQYAQPTTPSQTIVNAAPATSTLQSPLGVATNAAPPTQQHPTTVQYVQFAAAHQVPPTQQQPTLVTSLQTQQLSQQLQQVQQPQPVTFTATPANQMQPSSQQQATCAMAAQPLQQQPQAAPQNLPQQTATIAAQHVFIQHQQPQPVLLQPRPHNNQQHQLIEQLRAAGLINQQGQLLVENSASAPTTTTLLQQQQPQMFVAQGAANVPPQQLSWQQPQPLAQQPQFFQATQSPGGLMTHQPQQLQHQYQQHQTLKMAANAANSPFGPGSMYTAIPGESSLADSAHWNPQDF